MPDFPCPGAASLILRALRKARGLAKTPQVTPRQFPKRPIFELMKVPILFVITALAEIGGCYAAYAVLRMGRHPAWLLGSRAAAWFVRLFADVASRGRGRPGLRSLRRGIYCGFRSLDVACRKVGARPLGHYRGHVMPCGRWRHHVRPAFLRKIVTRLRTSFQWREPRQAGPLTTPAYPGHSRVP